MTDETESKRWLNFAQNDEWFSPRLDWECKPHWSTRQLLLLYIGWAINHKWACVCRLTVLILILEETLTSKATYLGPTESSVNLSSQPLGPNKNRLPSALDPKLMTSSSSSSSDLPVLAVPSAEFGSQDVCAPNENMDLVKECEPCTGWCTTHTCTQAGKPCSHESLKWMSTKVDCFVMCCCCCSLRDEQ